MGGGYCDPFCTPLISHAQTKRSEQNSLADGVIIEFFFYFESSYEITIGAQVRIYGLEREKNKTLNGCIGNVCKDLGGDKWGITLLDGRKQTMPGCFLLVHRAQVNFKVGSSFGF